MAVNVMKRVEMKYLLDPAQTAFLRERLKGRMEADEYGRTTIASLYYDTPSRQLIRASLDAWGRHAGKLRPGDRKPSLLRSAVQIPHLHEQTPPVLLHLRN